MYVRTMMIILYHQYRQYLHYNKCNTILRYRITMRSLTLKSLVKDIIDGMSSLTIRNRMPRGQISLTINFDNEEGT